MISSGTLRSVIEYGITLPFCAGWGEAGECPTFLSQQRAWLASSGGGCGGGGGLGLSGKWICGATERTAAARHSAPTKRRFYNDMNAEQMQRRRANAARRPPTHRPTPRAGKLQSAVNQAAFLLYSIHLYSPRNAGNTAFVVFIFMLVLCDFLPSVL